MNDNQGDIAWWNAFKEGSRDAFGNLFRFYYPFLLQYGAKFCPDQAALEDCIQDLFIELWQSRNNSQVSSIKAYLLKALKYKLFRHLKNARSFHSPEGLDDMHFELSHDHFMIRQQEIGETAKRLIESVNKLPNRQKEIVYLKIYQGLSYEEISEVMSINYQVARNLFYQSIKSLRSLMNNVL